MVTAWQQDRKRKQAGQLKSESVAGLEALLGGLSDIERQRIAEEERKRKAEAADAEMGMKTSAMEARTAAEKARAESSVLREKRLATETDAQNIERAARADVLRRKAGAEEADRKRADTVTSMSRRMDALTSRADVEKAAAEAGMAPDEFLAAVAEQQEKALGEQEKTESRLELEEARADDARASAEKKRRAPVLKPKPPRAARAPGAPDGSGVAPPKPKKILPPGDVADLSNEKNNIDALARIREMASDPEIMTGAVMGRIQSGAASVSDTAKWSKFTTAVQIANKLLARAVEGGRMTDADAAFYQKILASPNLGKGQFNAVLDLMDEMARETLVGKAQSLSEAGYDVPASILAVQKVQKNPAPAKAPSTAAGGKIKVTNGQRTLLITEDKLPAALADGFKVVRGG